MSIRIKTNVTAESVRRNLNKTDEARFRELEKLSSGKRITKAQDDSAGLSLATKMQMQVRSLDMALRNANDGVSFVQTAEGGLQEISNILIRLRELSIQSASDTSGDNERISIEKEYQSLLKEIQRIAEATTFNGTNVINGHGKGYLTFHVGANASINDKIIFNSDSANTSLDSIGLRSTSLRSKQEARDSMEEIDGAIVGINEQKAELGSIQSRLHSAINNIETSKLNHDSARSVIEDVDVAESSAKLASLNILGKAATVTLAQVNGLPLSAVKLLKQN